MSVLQGHLAHSVFSHLNFFLFTCERQQRLKISALISCLDSNSFQQTCDISTRHRLFLPQEKEVIPVTQPQHQYQQLAEETPG